MYHFQSSASARSRSGEFRNDATGTFAKRGGSTAPDLFYGSDIAISRTVNGGALRVDVGTLGLGYVGTVVENRGSIAARAAAGQPTTTLWLLNSVTSSGSIDTDYAQSLPPSRQCPAPQAQYSAWTQPRFSSPATAARLSSAAAIPI